MTAYKKSNDGHNYGAFDLWLVLLKHTDAHHGLTVRQMRDEIVRTFEDNPDHPTFKEPGIRTIYNYLDYLKTHRILGTQPRRIDVKELKAQGVTDYRPGTYITPIVDSGVATLLATMLRSSRLNSCLVGEVLDMLCNLTDDDDALPTLTKRESDDVAQANVSMMAVVRDLTEAITAGRAVTFTYETVDIFGEFSDIDELNAHAMTAATRFVDPYAVVVKNDRFHLIGHLHNTGMPMGAAGNDPLMGLHCYELDHVRDVRIKDDAIRIPMDAWDINGASRDDTELAPFDPITFINERTHMVMGAAHTLRLRVDDAMLGRLRDDYGHVIKRVKPATDSSDSRTWHIVTLSAAEEDMRMWLLEHAASYGAFAIWPEPFVREMAEVTRAHARTYTELTRYYDTRTACVAR